MAAKSKTNSFLGFLGGIFLSLKTRSKTESNTEDLKQMEFRTSTQKLGLRFTERIRDVFRFKWIR